MTRSNKLQSLLLAELRHLTTFHPSERVWQMPFAAALASGLPLLIGAWFDNMGYGLASSLGGLVFLYLPATPLHHRMAAVMASSFALAGCYTLGVVSHFFPWSMTPVLVFIAIKSTMVCRF